MQNGILHVSAKDKGTGKEQSIKIQTSSGLSDAEIERMKKRSRRKCSSRCERKEDVETINKARWNDFPNRKTIKRIWRKIIYR